MSGESGQVDMITKDAPYGTDATVAANGRWIEYNISTYTVTLYEGTNAVWSTNQTSNGKASTPTITGLYSVWNKTYEQCMPNPPSPTPLCNIHYVTYWERSGYAFHEAWWMTYAAGNVRQGYFPRLCPICSRLMLNASTTSPASAHQSGCTISEISEAYSLPPRALYQSACLACLARLARRHPLAPA